MDFTLRRKERSSRFVIDKQTVFRHPKAPMVYTYSPPLSTTLSSHIWDLHISKIFFCCNFFYTFKEENVYRQCVGIGEMYSNILQLIWNSQSSNNVRNHVDAVVHLGFLLPGTDKIPTRRPVSISTWCWTSPFCCWSCPRQFKIKTLHVNLLQFTRVYGMLSRQLYNFWKLSQIVL